MQSEMKEGYDEASADRYKNIYFKHYTSFDSYILPADQDSELLPDVTNFFLSCFYINGTDEI